MKIGIDFGTSYSAAAFASGDRIRKFKFASDDQFRTAVYFPEETASLENFEITPKMQKFADSLLRQAKSDQSRAIIAANARIAAANLLKDPVKRRKQLDLIAVPRPRSDDDLERDINRTVRQQWLEAETRRARTALVTANNAVFGDDAIERYLAEGTGRLWQSPKSMLGFEFNANGRATVVTIIANILEHIRAIATRQLKMPIREALIGRPVEFRSSRNEAALAILREAAAAAGFDSVEFMEEPIAAAIGFHRKSPERLRALVLDVGGGTTDLAYAELGGKRPPKILSSWGLGKGGTDVDIALSLEVFMPLFGYAASIVPNHHYFEASSVQDDDRQRKFRRHSYEGVLAPFGARLCRLQAPGMTTRLNRAVERCKIHLSDNENCSVRIGYIEKNLTARMRQKSVIDASSRFCSDLERLLTEVSTSLDRVPDRIFLTGGMSQSPYVTALAKAAFPSSRVVRGDATHGVVTGLALAAAAT